MLDELKRIKQIRQKLELTQAQLAKLANVSQSLITKIERDTVDPSYSIARKIFTVLEEQMATSQKEIVAKNICSKDMISIKSDDTIDKAIKLMKKHAISQMPITKDTIIVGGVSEEILIKNYDKIKNRKMKVEEIMNDPFPTIPGEMHISLIRNILTTCPAVIVTKQGKPTGIITKADILKRL